MAPVKPGNALSTGAHEPILGTTLEAIYQPARASGVRDSAADVSKAAALLGYVPTVSFEEGLARTIEWCRTESAATAGR